VFLIDLRELKILQQQKEMNNKKDEFNIVKKKGR